MNDFFNSKALKGYNGFKDTQTTMNSNPAATLREKIDQVLKVQGFNIDSNGSFELLNHQRDEQRKVHSLAKMERVGRNTDFILKNFDLVRTNLKAGKDIDLDKISPSLLLIESGTPEESLFKWWNLVWWSLPYERAYGRQMRFLVWDDYHEAPIGLIGLQSPILSWSVRDEHLGIPTLEKDFWVNQSLSAQRLGALPPYNQILGGKLVGTLMTSNQVRDSFAKKYSGTKTIMKEREIPSRLLFITTTGAFGKSSVYNRLKFQNEPVAQYIGDTKGSGSFHIPNTIYEELLVFLEGKGYNTKRGYGSGPSRKMRLISDGLRELGIPKGANHGVKRAVYLFPMVKNLNEVIQGNIEPLWNDRTIEDITDHWKKRWSLPRAQWDTSFREFDPEDFLQKTFLEIQQLNA